MRRIILTGLGLALAFSSQAGAGLAQSERDPGPSPSIAADTTAPESIADEAADVLIDADAIVLADPVWRKITPERGPAAREDHTWTVDAEGRFAYLFGGRDGGREFGDLWRYDLERDTWQRLSPRGRGPQPRFGHSAVWVEDAGVVVFGGQRGDRFFADLWAYDPAAERWRRLPRDGQPPRPRYGSCMVIGSDGRLWISHGFTDAGRFDDTRAYDLVTERWASIAPDARRPGERCLHDCFTASDGSLVLYAGQDDGAFALGDLWVLGDDRRWERLDDPRPEPRRLYGVTELGAHAYIFGGAGEDGRPFDDLWRVDRGSLDFEPVRVDGRRPAARYAGTLISDPGRGRLLLFGGQARQAKADVWELVERPRSGADVETSEASLSPLP